MPKDNLTIAGKSFESRLFLGTGKFSSHNDMSAAISSSGTQMVTVALRRVNLEDPEDDILQNIDRTKINLLPNTSGARNADEAVRIAHISRELGAGDWVKLEITPEPNYLLPDPTETLKASEILAKEGFKVMPYINADPILCKKLEDVGCVSVMPLGSPIGSNQGLQTKANLKIIIEQSNLPVIVDAGLGEPSHASDAMEIGASAVLINTAIAIAKNPSKIAYAFKIAVEAGRLSFLYRGYNVNHLSLKASASSPLTDFIDSI